jgi:son of sevenless-like protein
MRARAQTLDIRAQTIEKFISIAEECRKINNFNGLKALLTGLQCTPVYRLKKTWAVVASRRRRTFEELSTVRA